MYIPYFIYPFICWWVFGFLPLGYWGKCCYGYGYVNISLRLYSQFFNIYPEVEVLNHMVVIFLIFLKNYHTVSYSGWTTLLPTNNAQKFPIYLHSFQHLLFFVYLIAAILMGMTWYPLVVLISISLMVNEVEHLFICLLAVCTSLLEKCLFTSFAHF